MSGVIKCFADFMLGATIPFRATGVFFFRPKYWSYALVPLILSGVCYLVLGALGWFYLKPYIDSLLPVSTEAAGFIDSLKYVVRWIIYASAVVTGITVFLVSFTSVFVLLAAPFVDQLAVRYEKDFYNVDFVCTGFKHYVHYCWTSMINTGRVGIVILLLSLAFLVLNIVAPALGLVASVLIVGYYFGITFMIYSSEHRRIKFRDFKLQLHGSRALVAGMGAVIYVLMFIPFVAVIFLPASVIAGTIAYNEYIEPRSKK